MASWSCPVCGNDIAPDAAVCGYCESDVGNDNKYARRPARVHKTINLKFDRPLVETALRRLDNELNQAHALRVPVITLIHGYGSSGRGGKIRIACRAILDHLVQHKKLDSYICGERFSKRFGAGKALLRRYPSLEHTCCADFNNPGVTIVILW